MLSVTTEKQILPPRELSPEEKTAAEAAQARLTRIRKIRRQINKRNEAKKAEFREFVEPKRQEMETLRKEIGRITLEIEQVLEDFKPRARETRKEFEMLRDRKRGLELRRRWLYWEIEDRRSRMLESLEEYPPEADEGQLFEALEEKLAITGRLGPLGSLRIVDSAT